MRVVALSILLAGCEGSDLAVRNNEPAATIVFPREGDALVDGYAATLRGSVTDTNDGPEALVATWLSGDEELCPEAPIAADGSTTCDITVDLADTAITLVSRDPEGATGSATVTVATRGNDAPVVQLIAPDGAGPYSTDAYIVFEARVSDTEDAPADLALAWTDGVGTTLDLDTVVDTDGTLSGALLLAAGTHQVTLTATDIPGASGSASVTLEVAAPPEE